MELRCVPATISGQAFYDANANGAIDAGDTALAGVRVFLDTNNNGILDAGATKNYSISPGLTISSSGTVTVTSNLSVPDAGQIADLNVNLNIAHSFDGDLAVSLIGPTGLVVTLFQNVGGSGKNFTNTVLDDEAAVAITSGSAPFTGTFRPAPGSLTVFDGLQTNGTWTLKIQDTANQDGGTLNSWSLDVTFTAETTAVTPATGNYSFSGLSAGSYNVAQLTPAGHMQTTPGGDGRYHVSLGAADSFVGNFGNRRAPATFSGLVYNDLNGNGKQDVGEPPVSGVTVFLDIDRSGALSAADKTTTTGADGKYSFMDVVPFANYLIAEVVPAGFVHTTPIRLNQNFANINTSKRSGDQAEEAVAIDPTNPNRVFIMSNTLTSTGMSASVSTDGGTTWSNRLVATGSDGLVSANGDPTAAFDKFGNLWIAYLSATGINTIVGRSTNGGQSFTQFATIALGTDQPTIVIGPSSTPGRALVVVAVNDPSNTGQNVSYLEVDSSGPIGSFNTPVLVPSSNSGINGEFSDVAVGPNGQVAIAYINSGSGEGPDNIFFNLDPDGIGPQPFGARSLITTTNVGAFDTFPAQPSRSADSEPDLEFDTSGGPHNGRLYLLYTDEINNESNNLDIFVRTSDNNGASWSSRIRVNDDATVNSQFLPRMDLDQSTGNIAVTFYDARNDPMNTQVEYWGTVSFDGGQTYLPNIKLSAGKSTAVGGSTFDFGDYSDVSFTNGRFIASWADNSNSTGDNPNGTSAMDVYAAKMLVGNNAPNYIVAALPGQSIANLDFGMKGPPPALTVSIEQAAAQPDPTNSATINFSVVFSAAVSDFDSSDVSLTGTAGATTALVTGSGTTYNVAVSGMTGGGTVIASIAAGVATSSGTPNDASTSIDNTVTYDVTAPTAASMPADVTVAGATSYNFTVTFSDDLAINVASLDSSDIRVTGPGGFDVPAAFIGVNDMSNGSPRVATYSITPPGGSWDFSDNGSYAAVMQNGQAFDTAGNAVVAGTLGTFVVNVAPPPPSVTTVIINGGASQRSRVTAIQVDFSQLVNLPGNPAVAFELKRQSDNANVILDAMVLNDTTTHVTLTFTGGAIENGAGFTAPFSLQDGRYTLTITTAHVSNANGSLDGNGDGTAGDDYILASAVPPDPATNIFRFFGDFNGDGDTDGADFLQFVPAFLSGAASSIFDFEGDGDVDGADFLQFVPRFLMGMI